MNFVSATLLLLILMDPLGNLPVFAAVLKDVAPERRTRILFRELGIALLALIVTLFAGRHVFSMLHLDLESVQIAGGLVLAVIGYRMLFPGPGGTDYGTGGGEPFVVPLAIPMLAGPSVISTVVLLSSTQPERTPAWLFAILGAGAGVAVVVVLSGTLTRLLGPVGLGALERVMGLLLACISVQMVVNGVRQVAGGMAAVAG